jgi:hypothetical protein
MCCVAKGDRHVMPRQLRFNITVVFVAIIAIALLNFAVILSQLSLSSSTEEILSRLSLGFSTYTATKNETIGRHATATIKQNVRRWILEGEQHQPPNTPGALLHIGKTGGSTISGHLRNGCHSWLKKPCREIPEDEEESFVSQLTTYYHLPDFHTLGEVPYDFYVVLLRDPFDKLLSIFTYEHPKNIRARKLDIPMFRKNLVRLFKCFPSLESFSEFVGDEPDDYYYPDWNNIFINNTNCTSLARAIMHQQVEKSRHFYNNINYVFDRLEPYPHFQNATILAVRAENLWGDWESANQYLGQERIATFEDLENRRDYKGMILPVSKNVSDLGRKRLCRALHPEYQAYIQFLNRAENLNDNQRRESLETGRKNCPWLNLSLENTTKADVAKKTRYV